MHIASIIPMDLKRKFKIENLGTFDKLNTLANKNKFQKINQTRKEVEPEINPPYRSDCNEVFKKFKRSDFHLHHRPCQQHQLNQTYGLN